jgi:UDP-glucuronate decarboxylase
MDGNAILFDVPELPLGSGRAKTVLVAGGAGFVGSHLCSWLLDQGRSVICLDNLQTGRASNIAPLMSCDGFRFIRQDINDPFAIAGPIDQI